MLGFDDVPGDAGQRRIVKDHQVQIDESGELGRCAGRHGATQLIKLPAHSGHCKVKADDFFRQLFGRYFVVRNFEFRV